MLRRNQVTSSSPLPSEETTSKQNHDSPTDFFSRSSSPESPSAHSASPLRGLVGISERICSSQDSCLIPSQPSFPVVSMEIKGTTTALQLWPNSEQSSALCFTLHIGPSASPLGSTSGCIRKLHPHPSCPFSPSCCMTPSLPCFLSACVRIKQPESCFLNLS